MKPDKSVMTPEQASRLKTVFFRINGRRTLPTEVTLDGNKHVAVLRFKNDEHEKVTFNSIEIYNAMNNALISTRIIEQTTMYPGDSLTITYQLSQETE